MITRLEDCKIERLENYNKPHIAQIIKKFLKGDFAFITYLPFIKKQHFDKLSVHHSKFIIQHS
jgi:hypothetical protein